MDETTREEDMSNTAGGKREMLYKFTPKNKLEKKTYGARKLEPKIDHKIYSTKGSKFTDVKKKKQKKLEIAGNSVIVAKEMIVIMTRLWDMR